MGQENHKHLYLTGTKKGLGGSGKFLPLYRRDHRPDKKQITIGVGELTEPINVPIGFTVNKGNLHDTKHFVDAFQQIKRKSQVHLLFSIKVLIGFTPAMIESLSDGIWNWDNFLSFHYDV